MKRELLCPACTVKARKLFPTDTPYPGEHVKFVSGKALYGFTCDKCGCPIKEETPCNALSIWADYGGAPYSKWENDYIEEVLNDST